MGKIRQRKKGKGLGFKTNPKPNYSSALNPAPEPFPHLSWNMPCVELRITCSYKGWTCQTQNG